VDADTQYSGADFALSNQSCSVGQVVSGVDASGNVTCETKNVGIYSFVCGGCDLRDISLPGADLSNVISEVDIAPRHAESPPPWDRG